MYREVLTEGERMKQARLIAVLLAIAMIPIMGGCDEPQYIVYVEKSGCTAKTWDGDKIDDLWVFPKDRVVWVNIDDEEVTIKFLDINIFGVDAVTIPKGKRAKLQVKSDATGSTDYIIVDGTNCEPAAPTVKVGDPP
jgi:hypothetical protein